MKEIKKETYMAPAIKELDIEESFSFGVPGVPGPVSPI